MSWDGAIANFISRPEIWLGKALPSLLILVGGVLLIRMVRRYLRMLWQGFHGRLQVSTETQLVMERLLLGFLWALLMVIMLRAWGVDVTALWTTLLGILAVIGVGFLATWAMISNIAAHFFLWIWRPFHLGQEIEILPENLRGRVVETNLMFTELRAEDGHSILVPNNFFFQRIIRRAPLQLSGTGERGKVHGG